MHCIWSLRPLCLTGLTADGEKKIRPIDDLSRSGVNANTAASEKLRNDSLDLLVECTSQLRRVAGGRDHEVGQRARSRRTSHGLHVLRPSVFGRPT